MNKKVVILGLTGSGKSTIGKVLKDKYNLNVIEVDDKVLEMNNNVWPQEEKELDDFFEKINDEIIKTEGPVIYITSWLSKERIKQFHDKGFIIIELHANFETLLERKSKRDKKSKDQYSQFKENYQGYIDLINDPSIKSLFIEKIDTSNMASEKVFKKMIDYIL